MKKHPVKQLIEQGEGLHLDFKFEVSDAAKIARSLVAFANTEGGTLLIGVKDNGVIRGIRSEEEFYMIEHAAHNYCRPPVHFESKEWNIGGKKVLEIKIPVSNIVPHRAPNKDGHYKAYIRINDENILAPGVQMKIWRKRHAENNIRVTIENHYRWLLDHLKIVPYITVEQFKVTRQISKHLAEEIISDLIILDVLQMDMDEKNVYFTLK